MNKGTARQILLIYFSAKSNKMNVGEKQGMLTKKKGRAVISQVTKQEGKAKQYLWFSLARSCFWFLVLAGTDYLPKCCSSVTRTNFLCSQRWSSGPPHNFKLVLDLPLMQQSVKKVTSSHSSQIDVHLLSHHKQTATGLLFMRIRVWLL